MVKSVLEKFALRFNESVHHKSGKMFTKLKPIEYFYRLQRSWNSRESFEHSSTFTATSKPARNKIRFFEDTICVVARERVVEKSIHKFNNCIWFFRSPFSGKIFFMSQIMFLDERVTEIMNDHLNNLNQRKYTA